MGFNWFKKIKTSQISPLQGEEKLEDLEIHKGPKKSFPKYQVGMKVRDRRKSISQAQEFGKVDNIKDNKVKIIWNPGDKEKRREEIFDMTEDTEILSLIVSEV